MLRSEIVVFLAVLLLARATEETLTAGRARIAERLGSLVRRARRQGCVPAPVPEPVPRPTRRAGGLARAELALRAAGLRLRAREVVGLMMSVLALATGIGLAGGRGLTPGLWLAVLMPPMVWWLVQLLRRRRQARLSMQVGDALILMSNSLRAGHSFLQTLEVLAAEVPEPLGSEFGQVMRETAVNIEVETSLRRLVERTGVPDLELVVTAILIQRQVGGNLAEILDTISATVRERARVAREVRTLTAQGRMSGTIIGALPFGLGLIMWALNPGYVRLLFEHPLGRGLLLAGLIGEVLGVLVIRRLVDLKV